MAGDGAARPGSVPVLIRVADVEPESISWLWPGRIALKKLVDLVGDPGLGKSMLALDITARVTTGREWPDDPDTFAPVGNVVLLSAEDDIADTIRPRLDAAGAEVDRVTVLQAVRRADSNAGAPMECPFCLGTDLPALERAIADTGDVRLVVVDPVSAYLGGTDSHKNADVRRLLAPLTDLAQRYRLAVLVVSHLNKNRAMSAMYRTTGSLAFVAAARSVWVVARDPDDPDNPDRRLFLPVKNNLAPHVYGMAYTIETSDHPTGAGVLVWDPEPVLLSADEALAGGIGEGEGENVTRRQAAANWLRERLAAGPLEVKEIEREAFEAGFSEATLKRAKPLAGVRSRPAGFGEPWMMELRAQSGARMDSVAQSQEVSDTEES